MCVSYDREDAQKSRALRVRWREEIQQHRPEIADLGSEMSELQTHHGY